MAERNLHCKVLADGQWSVWPRGGGKSNFWRREYHLTTGAWYIFISLHTYRAMVMVPACEPTRFSSTRWGRFSTLCSRKLTGYLQTPKLIVMQIWDWKTVSSLYKNNKCSSILKSIIRCFYCYLAACKPALKESRRLSSRAKTLEAERLRVKSQPGTYWLYLTPVSFRFPLIKWKYNKTSMGTKWNKLYTVPGTLQILKKSTLKSPPICYDTFSPGAIIFLDCPQ